MPEFHPDVLAALWVASGIFGIAVEALLFDKFHRDIRARADWSVRRKTIYVAITARAIETSAIHFAIKLGVVVTGIMAMLQASPPTATSITFYGLFVTGFLVVLPWLLNADRVREYTHQRAMLAYGERMILREAPGSETA